MARRKQGHRRQQGERSMRAIAYVRVSTEEQARSGLGLAAQEERIRAYATLAGLELVDVIREEGISGMVRFDARVGGRKVLAALDSGAAAHVVALKLDRLFRDAANALEQTRTWDDAGVALHLLDMGGQAVNTASAMGRMFLTMAAGFAELERNLIAERTAYALGEKRSRGEKTGGDVPFGYRVAGVSRGAKGREAKVLEADPIEQRAVSLVVKLRDRGASLRSIAEALDAKGFRPRGGGSRWHPQSVANVLRFREAAAAA